MSMDDGKKVVYINKDKLIDYCCSIFTGAGMVKEEAVIVADSLVHADLAGMESHGVIRVPVYVKRIENKGTFAQSTLEIIKESDTTALIDGHNGMGQIISGKAMDLCIRKAEKQGVAFVGVRGSNHFGMASYYSEMALKHGMIGMVFTSPAALLMAPTGGIKPILDNNPFSFAIPSGEELPVVLDMATSVVSRGKIGVAAKKGEKIPKEWAMTIDGYETEDPAAAFNGILLPVGGYKGYGLTVIVGILSAVLTGGSILSTDIKDFYTDVSEKQNIGHLFGAVKIDRFIDLNTFKKHMDEMIREIKNCKKAPNVEEILLPGEREFKNAAKYEVTGIPVPIQVYQDLDKLGQRLNIGFLRAVVL